MLREDLVHPDPLLDALVEICRLQGRPATRASLAAGLPLPEGQLTLALAERAAARAGMATRLLRQPLAGIDPAALPALLLLHERRACVLLGFDAQGRARVLLPETGAAEIGLDAAELAARHTGLVLHVRPRLGAGEAGAAPAARPPGHWFWGAVLAQRWVYRDVLLAAVLLNLCALALPVFTMNVYDRVVPNDAIETLWALALGVLLAQAAELVLRLLRGRFIDEASARIDVQLSARLFEKALGLPLVSRPASVGAFAAHLRGFEQVRDFVGATTVTALVDLPFALLFMGALLWISPWLALPAALAFVVIVAAAALAQHRLHRLAEASWQASARRNGLLIESLAGLEAIKTQAAEGPMQARWERDNLFLAQLTLRMRALSNGTLYGVAWAVQGVGIAVVVIGVHLIGERALTLGALVAASILSARALAPAGQVAGLLMQYQGVRAALAGLDQVMALPDERAGAGRVQRRELAGALELRDLHFAYPSSEPPVLAGLNLRIQPGEHVAVIGRVGSGKTSLLRVLAGLYPPSQGALLLDGIDARQLDPADLRRQIGFVSQDVVLFQGTLRENIVLGLPHADDAAVLAAAEAAGLREWVDRHPLGFELPVGERGERLSGGQRQAVGLARALLHATPVVLLDEPTSAMDFSTEAQLTARLAAQLKGRTLVLVTHRSSLLNLAQRLVVLDQGRIVADGPREQVMAALQAGLVGKAA